ncbi:hypothetical protein A9Q84_00290 [Halobacteriovorax marinus]|uniref:Uncharacterized protein n=1 Tax=Halobacteriovorax marinus TaxID=97084 RepID=A0A1Y5FDG6_9BACT|nr:hypothetical protein A9Q84_00290 [Halobacteriovorax marinus]
MHNNQDFPKFLNQSPLLFGVNVWTVLSTMMIVGVLMIFNCNEFHALVIAGVYFLISLFVQKKLEKSYLQHRVRKPKTGKLYGRYSK